MGGFKDWSCLIYRYVLAMWSLNARFVNVYFQFSRLFPSVLGRNRNSLNALSCHHVLSLDKRPHSLDSIALVGLEQLSSLLLGHIELFNQKGNIGSVNLDVLVGGGSG